MQISIKNIGIKNLSYLLFRKHSGATIRFYPLNYGTVIIMQISVKKAGNKNLILRSKTEVIPTRIEMVHHMPERRTVGSIV
jgi:hypothetical protein